MSAAPAEESVLASANSSTTTAATTMTDTTYTVRDERGIEWRTNSAERSERLSRAGLTVTAVTHG